MIVTFLVAFLFSYAGSIPPGSINISVSQYAFAHKSRAAWRFSLAAALVEFPYVIIAVIFSEWVLSSTFVLSNFKFIAAIVMLVLGVINTISFIKKPTKTNLKHKKEKGFTKGIIISVLNPLAIPFWIGVTAYLKNMSWITLQTNKDIIIYSLGVSTGTFALLATIILLVKELNINLHNSKLLQLVPAVIFFILGFYSLFQIFN